MSASEGSPVLNKPPLNVLSCSYPEERTLGRFSRIQLHSQYTLIHLGSYFLVSLTLHFNIFESQFGLVLNTLTTIIILYLSYTALIITFKLVAIVLTLLKKTEGEDTLAVWINNELNFSLLVVLAVSSVYILVHLSARAFTIEEFCHIALWLWIA